MWLDNTKSARQVQVMTLVDLIPASKFLEIKKESLRG